MAATPTPPPTTFPAGPPVAPEPPGRGPVRRLAGRLLLVAALVAAAVGGVLLVERATEPRSPSARPQRFVVPALDVDPGAAVPQARPAPTSPDLRAWADMVAARTDIPARALVAYVNAELTTRARTPGCNLTWATLAGVGRVESHHGQYRGTRVGEDGRLSRPIIGIPLDGSPGVRAISDTDGGRLDGDTRWDRAVGAMQFLPTTWSRWSARANGDGTSPDPQNLDDAALTAARYLCASGGDLATGRGWWKAVLTYNESTKYGRDVFSGADAYARKAAELG
ncbi:murein transglycosylase [Actinokineospora sp.]|uniref:murein transglycosylase n=1 Tax=Actinokineospora sp. TaxID=1872133 RepID=UPI0040377408